MKTNELIDKLILIKDNLPIRYDKDVINEVCAELKELEKYRKHCKTLETAMAKYEALQSDYKAAEESLINTNLNLESILDEVERLKKERDKAVEIITEVFIDKCNNQDFDACDYCSKNKYCDGGESFEWKGLEDNTK